MKVKPYRGLRVRYFGWRRGRGGSFRRGGRKDGPVLRASARPAARHAPAIRLDAELTRLARGAASLRLSVGAMLDALSSSGGDELGFSSFEAYARERCERTGRWPADTRALARKLESLPQIRDATQEDGWMFECVRKVAEAVAGPLSSDRLLEVLLAEGYSTLFELVPESARSRICDLETLERDAAVESDLQAAYCADRQRWRNEAEELCERHLSSAPEFGPREAAEATSAACSSTKTPELLDREIRRACSELSERDLLLGIVAASAHKAEVWRRLGFATEAQYARERVGVSLSSLKAKRILAVRAGRVPELATALSSGRVGYEAAYLLSRVVTPATANEWIRHAERRTVKHLREEVEAAELLIRMGLGREQSPLDEASLDMLSSSSGAW